MSIQGTSINSCASTDTCHIHRKGHCNKPLTEREMHGDNARPKVRVRVEHVFGAQSNDRGGTLVRSIDLVRARTRIGLKNLSYNMRRLVQVEQLGDSLAKTMFRGNGV